MFPVLFIPFEDVGNQFEANLPFVVAVEVYVGMFSYDRIPVSAVAAS